MELTFKQREFLGQFLGNLGVAWIAGGLIGPFVTGWNVRNVELVVATSTILGLLFVVSMLALVGGNRNG